MTGSTTTVRAVTTSARAGVAVGALVLALSAAGCSTTTVAKPGADPSSASPSAPATSSATSSAPTSEAASPTSSSPTSGSSTNGTLVSDGGLIRVTAPPAWSSTPGTVRADTPHLYDAMPIKMVGAEASIEMFTQDFVTEKEFVAEVTKAGKASGMTCERVVIGVRYGGTTESPAVSVACDSRTHSRLVTRLDTTNTTTMFTIDAPPGDGPLDPVMQALIHATELRTPSAKT